MVLKKYLSLKNLNNSFMGTISSYGLVLMILALLHDLTRADSKFEKEFFEFNLGRALIHFFQVYGESFQTQYYLINAENEFSEASEGLG
jgi:DNA polymerase sigma